MQLPGNSRQRLRDAVRNHPSAAAWLNGRRVNALTKDELLDLADHCGIDPRTFVAEAMQAQAGASTAPTAPRVTPATPAPGTGQDGDGDRDTTGTDVEDDTHDGDGDGDGDESEAATDADPTADLTAEAEAIRVELATGLVHGNFAAVTERIAGLIRDARKPPVIETQTVYVTAEPGTAPSAPRAAPAPLRTETWGALFGIKNALASRKINVYPATPQTPNVDPKYRWPAKVTEAALLAFIRARHVWLYGPAGTGKSTFGEQLAARTGRPFFLIPCDDTTEAPELVGMTVPHQGGVRWQDGILTAAIRTPHAIVLIDEPTVARPGALMVLQSVLASRVLSIKETGEYVQVAEGVRFIVADNTNGTGGGAAAGYEGTRRMNRATLDRFAAFLSLDYMAPDDEADVLVSHTGCTPALAKILVECAGLTRKARVTHAIGLRRLIAWAEALTDGLDPRTAFEFTVLNACAKDDREPIEQCCALGLDRYGIVAALTGKRPAPGALSATADFS